jgi:DNA-binding transcriptional MerR regulator
MATILPQITFDFSDNEGEKEFLSGKPIPPKTEKSKSTRGRKSHKEWDEEVDAIEIPEDVILFQKQYYAIGEVCKMFKVNGSLLRYWEGEFNMKLRKNRKGDRFFTPADIKQLQTIFDLIRRRKFTIEGAKDYLKDSRRMEEHYAMIQSLQRIRSFLLELKAHL